MPASSCTFCNVWLNIKKALTLPEPYCSNVSTPIAHPGCGTRPSTATVKIATSNRHGLQRTSREICSGDDAVKIYRDRDEEQTDQRAGDPTHHDEEVVPRLQVVR